MNKQAFKVFGLGVLDQRAIDRALGLDTVKAITGASEMVKALARLPLGVRPLIKTEAKHKGDE